MGAGVERALAGRRRTGSRRASPPPPRGAASRISGSACIPSITGIAMSSSTRSGWLVLASSTACFALGSRRHHPPAVGMPLDDHAEQVSQVRGVVDDQDVEVLGHVLLPGRGRESCAPPSRAGARWSTGELADPAAAHGWEVLAIRLRASVELAEVERHLRGDQPLHDGVVHLARHPLPLGLGRLRGELLLDAASAWSGR